jgi:integration host factor subunit beta
MTKAELVEEVARAAELTKKDSEVIVEEVFKNIIQALNRGEKIELRGFGSFRVRQRDARRGRNPKTGEPVDIPAKRVPYFKPGKELKELINDGAPDLEMDDDEDDAEMTDLDQGTDNKNSVGAEA